MTMRLFRKFGLPDTGMMTGKMDINTVSQHLGRFLGKQENLGMLTQAVENKTESYGGVDGALEVLKKIDIEKAPNYFRAGFRTIGPQIIKLFAKKGLDITPLQNLWVKFGFDVKLIMDKDQTAKYGGKRGKLAKTRKARKIHGGAGGKTILMLWIVFLVACLYMSAASAANPRTAQELDTFQELKNGTVTYEGFTKGQVYHGLGELSKGNEKFYMNFIDGQPEKVGTIRYEDGTTFTGEIENYKPKGKGSYFNSHLGLECYGDFHAEGSDIVGLGECRTKEYTYQGHLRNFKPHGFGERITKSETTFSGTFENGLPEGYGILHVKNGSNERVYMQEGVAEYLTYMDLRNWPDLVKSHFTVGKQELALRNYYSAGRLVHHQITEEFLNEAKQTSAKASNFLQEIVDTKVQKKTLEDTRKSENTKQLEDKAIKLMEEIDKKNTKIAEKEAEKEALIQAYNQQLLLLNPKPESVPKRGKKNRNFNETEMLKFQNEGLQLKISELETKEDLLTQDISDLEKMVDDKMLEIKDNEDHIDRLSEKINSYKSELAYSGLENNLLQSEKANLEAKNKTLSKEIVDKTNEIMSYKNQLQNLNQTNSLLSEKNTNLEAEKDFLSKESVDKTNEINSYKSKIDTLNNEISQLNATQSELNLQINSLLKQIESKKTGVTRNNLFEIKELKYALDKIKKSGVYTAIENVAAGTFAETSIWPLLIFTLASLKMIHSKITSNWLQKQVREYEEKLSLQNTEIEAKQTELSVTEDYTDHNRIFDELLRLLIDQLTFIGLQLDFFKKMKADGQVSKIEGDRRDADLLYKSFLQEKQRYTTELLDRMKQQYEASAYESKENIFTLQESVSQSGKRADWLDKERKMQAQQIKDYIVEKNNLNDMIKTLVAKNTKHNSTIHGLQSEIARKKSEADALQEKFDNLTITNIRSDTLNKQLSNKKAEHEATILGLKMHIARIQEQNKEEIDTIKRGSQSEIASLAQQITEKTSKLGDLTGANTKQTSEIAELQKSIKDNSYEIKRLKSANTKKSKENDKKDRQIKKLEDDIQEKQSRIESLQEDIKKNNSLMANLQIDNTNLKQDNRWYQGHREDYERGQQKFDEKEKELESIIENLGERLKELQEQYAALEDILKGKVEEIKRYESSQQTPAGIVNMGTAENARKSASEPVSKAVESKAVESEPASEPKGQLDPRFKKYDNMRKFGQEDDAVRQKMNLDGITSDEIERYFSGEPMLLAAAASSTPAAQVDPRFKKYDNMRKFGQEDDAVRQKMKTDGFTPDEIEKYFSGQPMLLKPTEVVETVTSEQTANSEVSKVPIQTPVQASAKAWKDPFLEYEWQKDDFFVESNFQDQGTWLPVKISAVNKNGTYDIKYDDDKIDANVPSERVRCEDNEDNEEFKKLLKELDAKESIEKNIINMQTQDYKREGITSSILITPAITQNGLLNYIKKQYRSAIQNYIVKHLNKPKDDAEQIDLFSKRILKYLNSEICKRKMDMLKPTAQEGTSNQNENTSSEQKGTSYQNENTSSEQPTPYGVELANMMKKPGITKFQLFKKAKELNPDGSPEGIYDYLGINKDKLKIYMSITPNSTREWLTEFLKKTTFSDEEQVELVNEIFPLKEFTLQDYVSMLKKVEKVYDPNDGNMKDVDICPMYFCELELLKEIRNRSKPGDNIEDIFKNVINKHLSMQYDVLIKNAKKEVENPINDPIKLVKTITKQLVDDVNAFLKKYLVEYEILKLQIFYLKERTFLRVSTENNELYIFSILKEAIEKILIKQDRLKTLMFLSEQKYIEYLKVIQGKSTTDAIFGMIKGKTNEATTGELVKSNSDYKVFKTVLDRYDPRTFNERFTKLIEESKKEAKTLFNKDKFLKKEYGSEIYNYFRNFKKNVADNSLLKLILKEIPYDTIQQLHRDTGKKFDLGLFKPSEVSTEKKTAPVVKKNTSSITKKVEFPNRFKERIPLEPSLIEIISKIKGINIQEIFGTTVLTDKEGNIVDYSGKLLIPFGKIDENKEIIQRGYIIQYYGDEYIRLKPTDAEKTIGIGNGYELNDDGMFQDEEKNIINHLGQILIPKAEIQQRKKEIELGYKIIKHGGSKTKKRLGGRIIKKRFRGGRITKKRRETKMGRSKTKRHIKRR